MAEIPPLARAMGRIPSGLFILTAGRGTGATGLLTSFVQQAGFEPPVVTVAINKKRGIADLIRQDKAFCLSILRSGAKKLVTHFARGFEPDEPAFEGLRIKLCGRGIPYLADAHGHLSCEVVGESGWSDHVVFCGKVIAGACHDDATPWVHVRTNGLSY